MIVTEVAHHMALIPLLCLSVLHERGQHRDVAWWWLACAFAVSWVADTAAHWVNPDLVGNLYPLTQAAIVAFVFLTRRDALIAVVGMTLASFVALVWRGPLGVDVLFRTVAWGVAVGAVVDRPQLGRLRIALLMTFAGGLVAWYGYALAPSWTSWGVYQLTRAAGIALFCAAAWKPGPVLRVA